MLGGIGVIVKHNNKTIARIGKTALSVSVNFSLKTAGIVNNEENLFLICKYFILMHSVYHIYEINKNKLWENISLYVIIFNNFECQIKRENTTERGIL